MQKTNEEYTESRIDAAGLYSKGIKRLLQKNQGVIAGSFPLQCVLRETYSDSDIDFFFPSRARREVEKWFQKYCAGQKLGDPVGNYPKDHITQRPGSQYYNMNQIHSVYKFMYKRACVNIIFVNTNNVPAYVEDSFDLSFCKTMYDGRCLRFSDDTLNKIGQTCFNKAHGAFQRSRTEQRITKYSARGFTVIDTATAERATLMSDPEHSDYHILKLISGLPTKKFYKIAVRSESCEAWRTFLGGFKTAQRVRIDYPWACVRFDDFTVNLEPFTQNRHDAEVLVYTNPEELRNYIQQDRKKPYIIVSRERAGKTPTAAPKKHTVESIEKEIDQELAKIPAPVPVLSDAEAAARVCQLEFQLSKLLEKLAQKTQTQ